MLDPKIGQGGFRIGMFMVLSAGILTWVTDAGTPEHVISQITLIIGLLFLVLITILVRIKR